MLSKISIFPRTKVGKILSLTTLLGLTGSATIFLYEKDLRTHPVQIVKGMIRSGRMAICGVRMANIYLSPFYRDLSDEEKNYKAADILRQTFIKNSGTFIKLGQVLACLDVLIPDQYCEVMSHMFQNAPNNSFEDVKKIIESDIGAPLEQIFSDFDVKPQASASLAQVHKAILKKNGKLVAVKVQHPWLKETVQLDIDVFSLGIKLAGKLFNEFNYQWLIDDMNTNLPAELDFRNEAKNCMKIRGMLKNKNIKAPFVYENISSSKVLVMEYIDGYSITDVERMKKDGINVSQVAKLIANCFNDMIFKKGFVHADPHPGNIFITPKKHGDFDLVLLDHGLYRNLSELTRHNYSNLWTGIILQKEDIIKDACEKLGVGEQYPLFTAMVTNQQYSQVMNKDESDIKHRLQGKKTDGKKNKEKAKNLALHFRRQIIWCLEKMNRELVLIFKVNDYIKSIDNKLGKPVNNYYYITQYALNDYIRTTSFKSVWHKLYFKWLRFKILISIKIYEFYLSFLPSNTISI